MVAIRRQKGFSYWIVLFLVAALSIVSVRALENTLTKERREKETELLWRGLAYREAIRMYYESSPGTAKSYPAELQDLLLDTRFVRQTRPLRRLYPDPMSGESWGVTRNQDGRVVGVFPQSNQAPVKRAGFPKGLEAFTNAETYRDWKFAYQPNE